MSRDPNRNRRAAESQFTRGSFESRCLSSTRAPERPAAGGSSKAEARSARARPLARARQVCSKPRLASSPPPRKKPRPFNVFFEPVSQATHFIRPPASPAGTTSLT